MKRHPFDIGCWITNGVLIWGLAMCYTFMYTTYRKSVVRTPLIRRNNLHSNRVDIMVDQHDLSYTDNAVIVSPSGGNKINRTMVLLMAYYRSGSSFLGQIFAQNPQSFYWFEPLESDELGINKNMLRMKNSTIWIETDFQLLPNGSITELPRQMTKSRTETLIRVLNCQTTNLSQSTLSGKFFNSTFGKPRLAPYVRCLRNMHQNRYEICSRILQDTCQNSSLVVAKVIRYPMYELRHLEQVIPDLKVIHYVRDPRGVITSRANLHGWSTATMTTNVGYLCARMAYNLRIFKEQRKLRPANHLQVKYEDLALKNRDTAREIYRFIGHELPDSVQTWITKHTTSAHSGPYGTSRLSTHTAYKWRDTWKGKRLEESTKNCEAVLRALDYEL